MDTWQTILAWAALAVVYGTYVPWIARRLKDTPGRRAPDRDRFLLLAPIGMAAIAWGVAFESWQDSCGFALFGFFAVRLQATTLVNVVRAIRRRRPVKPAHRQRRIEERAARRRARAHAMERYGPPAQ